MIKWTATWHNFTISAFATDWSMFIALELTVLSQLHYVTGLHLLYHAHNYFYGDWTCTLMAFTSTPLTTFFNVYVTSASSCRQQHIPRWCARTMETAQQVVPQSWHLNRLTSVQENNTVSMTDTFHNTKRRLILIGHLFCAIYPCINLFELAWDVARHLPKGAGRSMTASQ